MSGYVGYNSTLVGTCGVGLLATFSYHPWESRPWTDPTKLTPTGGAGWAVAGFTPIRPGCKEVYEEFKARWPIVLQTVNRRNSSSGNSFIFVVYDTKKKRKSKNNPEGKVDLSGNNKYKWPWK
jgi:hypothetical protein